MSYDYVVIGGGVAGMTSALILARQGMRVALVEKSRRLAPLLRGFSRREIFFDTGFHYSGCLGDGEILDTLLRYLGLADKLEKRPYARDGFDIVRSRSPQWEFRFPWGGDDFRQALHERFPDEKPAIDSYLDTVFRACDTTPFMNLDLDLNERGRSEEVYDETLQDYLDGLSDNEDLKGLFSLHCLLYGVLPSEVALGHHALIVAPYYRSTHGIRGGGGSVVRAFAEALKSEHVDIFCGRGVEEILFDDEANLTGVRLAGGEVLASSGCISTVHPHCFVDMVPDQRLRPAFKKRLSSVEETSSAFILYGGCHGSLDFLRESNMFFIPESARAASLGGGRLEDRPLYLTSAWHKSDSGANPGFMAICPASYHEVNEWGDSAFGDRPADYRRFKDEVVDRLGRHLEEVCPELRGQIAWMEGSTPLTVRDFVHTPFGSLYGAKRRVGQHTVPPLTRYKNLFLAGQAVTAPGLLGAMISGVQACGHIFGHHRIFEDLRKCS